jgi:Integrase core domain
VRRSPKTHAQVILASACASTIRTWQNGHVERLIGSIRRECLDHVVVFGEAHLRRVLKTYASYYNKVRTRLSLDKNAPTSVALYRWATSRQFPSLAGCIINMSGIRF